MSEPKDEDEVPEFKGPDPREWETKLPAVWGLMLDIETVDRVLTAMKSTAAPASHPGYDEAVQFLTESAVSLRVNLALALLGAYGIPVPEQPSSPFETAGKARAFGVDIPVPPGNV